MDGYNKKQEKVPSTSSFTADLFGFKEPTPSSSSSGVFASIFQPPSSVLDRNPPISEVKGSWQKYHSQNPGWNTKQGTLRDAGSYNMPNNNDRNTIEQEQRVQPCHWSSSIYYGGQDYYVQPKTTQSTGSYPIDGGEDDPNGNSSQGASRGNWWKGSLYY